MKTKITSSWPITVALIIILLIYGQRIILPLIIAVLIWFIVKYLRTIIDKIGFIHRYVPQWIKTILATTIIFGLVVVAVRILSHNIQNLAHSYNTYVSNIYLIADKINTLFGINISEEFNHFIMDFDFISYLNSIFNSLSGVLSDMVMIFFYVIFLLIEEQLFANKIKLMFPGPNQFNNVQSILGKIDKSLSSYIIMKSFVSFLNGLFSYIVLVWVGLDSPLFWAFLIFMLNFIPSIGSILGSLIPFLFALIQFGEFVPALIILIGTGSVSVLIGYIVEPKLMGNTLNISPLVAILSLAVWGYIWGVTGMLLSVPITVAMIIIMAQFENTRPVAILLSEKGKI